MTRVIALVAASFASASLAQDMPPVPLFVEETATAGIDSVYAGDWEYMVGGGVAAFD